jgi:uncharacterized protein
MSISMFDASVPVLQQMLASLALILERAQTHAQSKNIEPQALLQARLFPDMFPLLRQVQIACEFARSVPARLSACEVPVISAEQNSFADLLTLVGQSQSFIASLPAAGFADSQAREIVLRPGTPKEKKLSGQTYLSQYGLPQFFFHVTTSYAILRHNGVELGKKDFMGTY